MANNKKRIVMSELDKDFLSKLDQYYQDGINVDGKQVYLKKLLSLEGKKSVVWKVTDKYQNQYALKLATFADYVDRSFDQEMIQASKLNKYNQFARIEGANIQEFKNRGKSVKCVAFLEEWIDGVCLDKLPPESITVPFIIAYIEKFCDIIYILKTEKLRHDDLHSGNVMIVNKKSLLSDESSLEVKVIDLGSLKDYYLPLKPIKNGIDDTINFAIHIKYLLNKLYFTEYSQRRILNKKEKRFIEEATVIINMIIEPDKQRALSSPYHILKNFKDIYQIIFGPTVKKVPKLGDPFDYLSAEQISDDGLLINLFAESCPWINEVISPNPILLTGPRGCGKSMIFRRYSLKALLSVDDKLLEELSIAGFYISCSADLSNRFSMVTTKPQAVAFKEEIIHYFNLTLLKEIVLTLKIISERSDCFEKFGINDGIQGEIFSFITNILKIQKEKRLRLQGVKPLVHLSEIIKFELNETYTMLVKRNKLKQFTTFSFISDLTKFLTETVPYFQEKKITFLIDDYSIHRIPEDVQSLLNMIIWDRQSTHIFKISSEKYGAVRSMYNNTSADLSREYTEIDIGRIYVNLSETSKKLKKFSSELLNHRLKLADYSGKCENLIGTSNYKRGSLGKQIFSGENSNEFFHGIETISQVCSGDISTLLEIYRTIFRDSDIKADSTSLIARPKQHNAIVSTSRNFLDLTKTFMPYGIELYTLVSNFGNLCKKILTEGRFQRDTRNGEIIPNETTRIEIEETAIPEQFTKYDLAVYREMVRRAIFIELEPSRSRHTYGITTRLQLRRIYCPSFGVSLSKNTAIKWTQSEFKAFMIDPKNKCESEFDSRWKKEDGSGKQLKMF